MLCQNNCAFIWLFRRFFVPLQGIWVKPKSFMSIKNQSTTDAKTSPAMGRTELAQHYFPYIQPQNAWQKLRALLNDEPALAHLTTLRRRTFLPNEVNMIFQHLGRPWRRPLCLSPPRGYAVTRFHFQFSDFHPSSEKRWEEERGRFKTSILFILLYIFIYYIL